VDAAFAEVVGFLRRRNLYDASVVVFTSDHGESLGEHRYYFEHGWFADDASLRVPLVIKAVGQHEGRVSDEQVSNLDLCPTLLAIAGGPGSSSDEPAAGSAPPALNLLGAIAARPPLLVENADAYPEKFRGVRTRRWKYLVRDSDGAEELYDLERDAGETRNVAGAEPERVDALRRAFRDGQRSGAPSPPRPSVVETVPPPPELIDRLRMLGYIE